MERALDRGRHVLGPRRLLHADGVVAGEPDEPPGEERLVGQMPAVLLADEDNDRCAVDARSGDRRHTVPEPCGRVQQRERRRAAPECVPRRETDH